MTCVVGVRAENGVLLAGDTQYSWANRNAVGVEAKTFELSELIAVAYCGSARLGQILSYRLVELNDPALGRDELEWCVNELVPYLRMVLEAEGFLHIWRNVEHFGESAFLLAVRDRLFLVESDLSIAEHARPFDMVGSGEEVALGAMATLVGTRGPLSDWDEVEAVAHAGVSAAAEFTNFVGGDMTSVRTAKYTADELAFARAMLGRRSR